MLEKFKNTIQNKEMPDVELLDSIDINDEKNRSRIALEKKRDHFLLNLKGREKTNSSDIRERLKAKKVDKYILQFADLDKAKMAFDKAVELANQGSDVKYINHRLELIFGDHSLNEKLWWRDPK